MIGRGVGVRSGRIVVLLGLLAAVSLGAVAPAEAARKRQAKRGGYAPPQAAIVVDAKTGKVLYGQNEDAPRIPASITKVMTLYVLFEQMEKGRFSAETPMRVSAYAAAQAPSKLGLQAGDTIRTEDAIKALVTKSANDVAVVVAENVGGSEAEFARMMTNKARQIGMASTTFRNPHGLPANPPNITTARDLATLGRAIQDRFPRYYAYFGTRVFHYQGSAHANHNKLLGRVEGVDGIKTGFTRASGFNLLTSAKTDDRHVVAVVLGGRSGASRDQRMASLIDSTLPRAYAGRRTAPIVAEAPVERARPAVVAAAGTAPSGTVVAPVRVAQADPAPAAVTTGSVKPPLDLSAMRPVQASMAGPTATPSGMRWNAGPQGAPVPPGTIPSAQAPVAQAPAPVLPAQAEVKVASVAPVAVAPAKAAPAAAPEARRPSGWSIQLGAAEDESKARAILENAKAKSPRALGRTVPYTEKVVAKGGETLYRARFAGFEEADEAQAACKALKRSGFACFATRG